MESTFAVQQHIQNLIRKDPSDIKSIVDVPEGQDKNLWRYELLRYVLRMKKDPLTSLDAI